MILETHLAVKELFSGFTLYGQTVNVIFVRPKGEVVKRTYPCINIVPGDTKKNNEFESEYYEFAVDSGSAYDVYPNPPKHYNLDYGIHIYTAGDYALRDETTLIENIFRRLADNGVMTIESHSISYDLGDFAVVSRSEKEEREFHQVALLRVYQQMLVGEPDTVPANVTIVPSFIEDAVVVEIEE